MKSFLAAVIFLAASHAAAQTTIRPRVLLMVDTSGSMTLELASGNDTGADGSTSYTDGLGLTRDPISTPGFAYGEGFSNPAATCVNPTSFRGTDSRMFAAKSAVNNVLNASGEIDWGLMRYAGDFCAITATAPAQRACSGGNPCQAGGTCTGGVCHCASDNNCRNNEFCIAGICSTDGNLCLAGMYGMADSRGTSVCRDHYALPGTYNGSCGTTANCFQPEYCDNATLCQTGAVCSANACTCTSNGQCAATHICSLGLCVANNTQCTACQSLYTCAVAADCMGGACNAVAGSAAKACACSGNAQCPTAQGYSCINSVCTYNRGCRSTGGIIEVDPKLSGSNAKIFPWVDGKEDYTGAAGAFETLNGDISTAINVANPELRSKGNTPLAGSARTGSNWYNAIRAYTVDTGAHPNCLGGAQNDSNPLCDSKLKCRPYVLVQLTDGVDTCEGGGTTLTDGPPAAARGFVNATVDGARVLNKVYVIGLSVSSMSARTELNNIAIAGGSGAARFANTAVDIEAALSDIVSSSVLVERCNNADDDCNGSCDEPFPDVAVSGAGCSNPRAAKTCSNGELAGTHCAATGAFQCSADGLSEVCTAPTCTGNPEDMANPTYAVCPRLETLHGCNGQDDDCNGVVDDCTPFVAGSCCTSVMCPACNPTGVPQTELCNACDDDCDGIIDNHLMDPAVGVSGGPPCVPLQSGHDQLPCKPGVTICLNGQVVCDGEVLPEPNQCDGVSRDCTGMVNSNGSCPAQTVCFMGICAVPCGPGEFPCPGGFVCKEPEHLCVPDVCVKLNCAPGTVCKVADDGTATCTDPCDTLPPCPAGFLCQSGVCKENTCRIKGCPDGQICSGNPPACIADPCTGVACPAGQFCNGGGSCEMACANGCDAAQVCIEGGCQSDPCVNRECGAGEVCLASAAGGACVENLCQAGCSADLFDLLRRPVPARSLRRALLRRPPLRRRLGLQRQLRPHRRRLHRRRRRRSVRGGRTPRRRRLVGAAVVAALVPSPGGGAMMRLCALLLALSGCTTDPFCLSCGRLLTGDDLGGKDLAGLDLLSPAEDLAGPCAPTGAEVCDGKDNDCNTLVDDVDPSLVASDPNNCGACGNVCNFQMKHQFGGCTVSVCVTTGCFPSFFDIDGDPANGCEYSCTPTIPPDEQCDGRDNDCDGQKDNGVTPPAGICSNKGVCKDVTIPTVCTGASGWKCDYSAVPDIELDVAGRLGPIETKCDTKDNNCNGVVDKDGFPTLDNTCTAGVGACQNSGKIVCTSGTTAGCNVTASPGRAKNEECNDIDDNCDGQRDERTPAVVTMCGGVPCLGYVDPMVAIGSGVFMYEFEASRPDATLTSPGGVARRACSKIDALPWASVTEAQAVAACAAVKDSTGASMRLCTSAEWERGCEGAAGAPAAGQSKWAVTPLASPPGPDSCNDVRGAGVPWATGHDGGGSQDCYASWNAGARIYDLSGNLAEWTSTQVTAQMKTYNEVRGGAFNSPVGGTSCEFDFVIFEPTFVDSNLGFRCCADHSP